MSLNDQMAGFSDPDYQPLIPGNVNQGQHVAASVPAPVKAKDVKVARDRAQYVRQQKPKSWIVWWLILGPVTLWIPAVYFSFSPNYFWKL